VEAADLKRCYDIVNAMPLRRYKMKDIYISTFHVRDTHRLGFLANELEPYFPNSVVEQEVALPGYSTLKTIDTQQMEMAHLGATKYLIQQVSTLQLQLDDACAQISTLESLGSN
jgi:hypothetical protein